MSTRRSLTRRTWTPPDEAQLYAAALSYLARFAVSSARLRQHLLRRAAPPHENPREAPGEDEASPDAIHARIDAVLARLRAAGLLNDGLHAEARALHLVQRGVAPAVALDRMRREGISSATAAAGLTSSAELQRVDIGKLALVAAIAYARRRRLGPFGDQEVRSERRQRDLAAMARAGHAFDVARAVIDGEAEALEARVREP